MQDRGDRLTAAHARSGPFVICYWGSRGGGSMVALAMAQRLRAQNGPDAVRLSLREDNEELAQFADAGFSPRLVRFPDRRNLARLVRDLPLILRREARAIAAENPRAAVFCMNFPLAWPLVHMLHLQRAPVTYLVHDAAPHPGDYARTWQVTTQTLLIRSADRLVTLSEHVREELAIRSPRSIGKTRVLPLAALLDQRVSGPRAPSPGEPVKLLFLGRLIRYKGLDLLAEALAPLKGDQRFHLTIAGSGPMAEEVSVAFSGWPNVSLRLEWLSKAEFDHLLLTHHLLLCPYAEASQSGVIAEAAVSGLPALVLPRGALADQIGRGRAGFVASAGTAAAFRQMLEHALADPGAIAEKSQGALDISAESRRLALADFLSA